MHIRRIMRNTVLTAACLGMIGGIWYYNLPKQVEAKKEETVDTDTTIDSALFYQIDAQEIYAQTSLYVYEEADTESTKVGSANGGCRFYLIEEYDDEWYYVESGNVRGFAEKSAFTTDPETGTLTILNTGSSYSSYRYIVEEDSDSVSTASALVDWTENSAYTYTLTTAQEVKVEGGTYALVTASTLNVREGEGTEYDVVGTISKNSLCYVMMGDVSEDEWVYVESGTARGYVASEYLNVSEGVQLEVEENGEEGYSVGSATCSPSKNDAYYDTIYTHYDGLPSGNIRDSIVSYALSNTAGTVEEEEGDEEETADVLESVVDEAEDESVETEERSEDTTDTEADAETEGSEETDINGSTDTDQEDTKDADDTVSNTEYITELYETYGLEISDLDDTFDIEDAQSGDILVDEDGEIAIYDGEDGAIVFENGTPETVSTEDYVAAVQVIPESETTGEKVVDYALQFVGNPYVWGGTSLTNGADCSGFVMSVYANFDVSLPHYSGSIANCGTEVSWEEAEPGDILCYSGHVAILVSKDDANGNGTMVHAQSSRTGITTTTGNLASYKGGLVTIRRVTE